MIYGLYLPEDVLEKIYRRNAQRILFGIEADRGESRAKELPILMPNFEGRFLGWEFPNGFRQLDSLQIGSPFPHPGWRRKLPASGKVTIKAHCPRMPTFSEMTRLGRWAPPEEHCMDRFLGD